MLICSVGCLSWLGSDYGVWTFGTCCPHMLCLANLVMTVNAKCELWVGVYRVFIQDFHKFVNVD
jgi:hypothetical protein